jgi:hypothetical protein
MCTRYRNSTHQWHTPFSTQNHFESTPATLTIFLCIVSDIVKPVDWSSLFDSCIIFNHSLSSEIDSNAVSKSINDWLIRIDWSDALWHVNSVRSYAPINSFYQAYYPKYLESFKVTWVESYFWADSSRPLYRHPYLTDTGDVTDGYGGQRTDAGWRTRWAISRP